MKKYAAVGIVWAYLFLLSFVSNAGAITTSGQITSAETWSGTIELTGDVTVTETGQLTISPGTQIKCMAKSDDQAGGTSNDRIEVIVVWGTLIAEGTETNPIVFTSSASTPAKGDWYGLRIKSENSSLKYCTVEYGNKGIRVEGGVPVIENCTIQKNSSDGVHFTVTGTISSSTISENEGMGIHCDSGITLNNTIVRNNKGNGVSGESVTITDSTIRSNEHTGVVGTRVTMTNSTVSNSRYYGINLRSADGGINLNSCTISENGSHGIYGVGKFSKITTSTIRGNKECGIGDTLGIPRIVSVDDCSVTENGNSGIECNTVSCTNSTIRGNGGSGIKLRLVGTEGIEGNTITSNRAGVETDSNESTFTLPSGNDIYNNTEYQLRNSGNAAVTANGNYWGNPTTSELQTGVKNLTQIYDSRDNADVGLVYISTFLDKSVSASPVSMNYSPIVPSGTTKSFAGEITGTQIWTGTIFLTGDVIIKDTGKLTISPGTRIISDFHYDSQMSGLHTSRIEMIVDWGTLIAEGTETNPIVFTSSASTPAKRDWYGLRIKSENASLKYCTVEYGNKGIRVEGGVPVIENCTIQKNSSDGVHFTVTGTISSSTISENEGMGIHCDSGITLNNTIVRNNKGNASSLFSMGRG